MADGRGPSYLGIYSHCKSKEGQPGAHAEEERLAQEEPGGMLTIKEQAERGTSEEREEPE